MHKVQVEKFYRVLWDAHNKEAMPEVLHEDFTFRGSLGEHKYGYSGFAEYVDRVHTALRDYRCIIEELIEEDDKVFAKMTFTGIHQNIFMSFAPTHKQLSWKGCALFTFRGERIADLWVLGDLKSLEQQLQKNVC